MKQVSRTHTLAFWLGVLLLALLPFAYLTSPAWAADVVHQEADEEEAEKAQEEAEEGEEQDAEAEITLATGRAEGTIVQPGRAVITARGNHMLIDSPGPLGGPNETYNPLDAFLGGVLTCALFIYETAAQEMDIPLNSISGAAEADFAVQGLIDGSVDPRIRAFRVTLELDGPSAEEAEQLREQYMLRCPFYTTLIRSAPIEVIHVGVEDAAADADDADAEDSMAMDHGDNAPPGPTVFLRADLPIEDAVPTTGIVQTQLAFAPGAWTPPHVHGGQTIVTTLDGEITNNINDVETTYGPGEGWSEQPNVVHMAGNASDEIGHVLVTFITPEGEPLTTMVEGMVEGELPPGPTGMVRGEMNLDDAPAAFTAVQLVLDFAPGAWTPPHYHGGDGLVTVLEGEMIRRIDGVEETFGVGESWIEEAEVVHAAGNDSDANARVAITFVLPPGAVLTTVVEE